MGTAKPAVERSKARAGKRRRTTAELRALAAVLVQLLPGEARDQDGWARWIEAQISAHRGPAVTLPLERLVVQYYYNLAQLIRGDATGALSILAVLGFHELINDADLRSDLHALCDSWYNTAATKAGPGRRPWQFTDSEKEAERLIKRSSDRPAQRATFNAIRSAGRRCGKDPSETLHTTVTSAVDFSSGGELYILDDLSDMMPHLVVAAESVEMNDREKIKFGFSIKNLHAVINRRTTESVIHRAQTMIPIGYAVRRQPPWEHPTPDAIKAAIMSGLAVMSAYRDDSDAVRDIERFYEEFASRVTPTSE